MDIYINISVFSLKEPDEEFMDDACNHMQEWIWEGDDPLQ